MKIVCYADDATLTSESEDDPQRILHTFKIQAEKDNTKISTRSQNQKTCFDANSQ
jgi:hypothetical protein